jgi:hypothetical protein
VPAEQAARQHAVGGDTDPKLTAGGQDLRLDAAAHQRALDLQVRDRVHRGGAAQGFRADLGQADVADVAGVHQLGDGADGVLDRHVRVEPRRAVDVDRLDTEALQRVRRRGLHRHRARIVSEPGAAGIALGAELHADRDTVAAALAQRLGDQQLVVAHAVEVAGVEQHDAGFARGGDGGKALLAVRRPIER